MLACVVLSASASPVALWVSKHLSVPNRLRFSPTSAVKALLSSYTAWMLLCTSSFLHKPDLKHGRDKSLFTISYILSHLHLSLNKVFDIRFSCWYPFNLRLVRYHIFFVFSISSCCFTFSFSTVLSQPSCTIRNYLNVRYSSFTEHCTVLLCAHGRNGDFNGICSLIFYKILMKRSSERCTSSSTMISLTMPAIWWRYTAWLLCTQIMQPTIVLALKPMRSSS